MWEAACSTALPNRSSMRRMTATDICAVQQMPVSASSHSSPPKGCIPNSKATNYVLPRSREGVLHRQHDCAKSTSQVPCNVLVMDVGH